MKNEVIQYLNSYMNQASNAKYQGLDSLFKYRPFDEFTFDMLENNYLYLSPVEKLDDKTECDARLDLNRLMDLETNNLKKECVEQIIQMIRPHTSIENYEEAKSRIQRIAYDNGVVRRHFMLDLSKELQNLVPDFDFSQFINYIVNIDTYFNRHPILIV